MTFLNSLLTLGVKLAIAGPLVFLIFGRPSRSKTYIRLVVSAGSAVLAYWAAMHAWRYDLEIQLFGRDWIPAWIFWAALAVGTWPGRTKILRATGTT